MEEKIIVASFKKTKFARTETQWRYNVGQKLQFEGIELPPTYQVHFSNSLNGTAKSRIGDSTGVSIPQEYFIPGSEIYAWIYLNDANTGVTVRQVTIPVHQKARVTDQVPDPDEQSVIDQTIALLNETIEAIPTEIENALAAAKASGEFNGNNIWWTVTIPTNVPIGSTYYGIDVEELAGREDVAPAVDDLVYAPPSSGSSHQPTCLYRITVINGETATLAYIGSLKGDQGFSPYVEVEPINHGHRVTITDEVGPTSFDVMDGHVGNMEADLQMNGYHIKNLAEGVEDTDGVNKAQVLKMIGDGSGVFRGSYPTKAFLNSISWQNTDPNAAYYVDNNDYAVVLSDETQHYECWRYSYAIGRGWLSQYRINEAPMTSAQIDAINSGITASRLVALEQFKNAGQPKLDGIEAGAQVNDIEHIRAWDETTGEYVELPISNKTVDIPQSSGGSELPPYSGSASENKFLKANYPNGELSWENITDIFWIRATVSNNTVSFPDYVSINDLTNAISRQFGTLSRFPTLKLSINNIKYELPLVKYQPGDATTNVSIVFSGVDKDTIHSVRLFKRAGQNEYTVAYSSYMLTPVGIGAIPAPYDPSNDDVLTYDESNGGWIAKAPASIDNGLPDGGSFNQILRKNSSTDYDASWTDEKTEVIIYDFSVDEFGDITTTADPIAIWSNIDTYGKAQYARVYYENEIILLPLRAYQSGRIDFYGSVAPGITVMIRTVYDNDWAWIFSIDEITPGTFDYTELDNKPSINGVELDGALTGADLGLGTYSKPSGGIPKTDLESAAQTSLGKADSAYQKPSGGIPASDLASAVQTSLGKADTALQSYTETDPTVPNWAKVSSKPSYTASEVGAVASNQGTGNAGKFLVVGFDGVVTPVTMEVTNTSTGDVTLALDPGKIYHFTGSISSLTLTLTAAGAGQLAQYHFDFNSGSTAATVSITGVTWQGGNFTPSASKHYEVDILNGYGVVAEW